MSEGGATRRTVLRGTGAGAVVALGAALGVDRWSTSRAVEVPLHSETVAFEGPETAVEVGSDRLADLVPGTRVLRGGADAPRLVAEERAWLAQGPAWVSASDRWGALARSALLDLRVLTLPDGAHVAGWSPLWHYVWPRDSSHVAAALVATGHVADAVPIARFLAAAMDDDGWCEARYLPDGSGAPDDRPRQLDGTGWAMWAAGTVVGGLTGRPRNELAAAMTPMVTRGTQLVLDLTTAGSRLPPASPDYWEVPEHSVTLGTVAPLVIGLHSAARVFTVVGDSASAARATGAATSLLAVVGAAYGPGGYPRHVGGDDPDAALAFLAPPYAVTAPSGLGDAVAVHEGRMRRTAGGVAPGASWKDDGISWTPETALLALAYAGCGRRVDAQRLLGWLDTHRTAAGSFPEKVLWNGEPASVAPLGWTAALVLLALDLLQRG